MLAIGFPIICGIGHKLDQLKNSDKLNIINLASGEVSLMASISLTFDMLWNFSHLQTIS